MRWALVTLVFTIVTIYQGCGGEVSSPNQSSLPSTASPTLLTSTPAASIPPSSTPSTSSPTTNALKTATYYGLICGGGSDKDQTDIVVNPATGAISGSYEMKYTTPLTGTFSNMTWDAVSGTLSGQWADQFGNGYFVFIFNSDKSQFLGQWGYQPQLNSMYSCWNGTVQK